MPLDDPCVAQWARLGSGSAIRSAVVPPSSSSSSLQLVSWQGSVARVHAIHPSLRDLRHTLVVFDPFPKPVGSSTGHGLAPTCPFHTLRTAMADSHTADVVEAFEVGDLARVRDLTEAESLTMHLVMLGSTPSLRYMNDASIDFASRFVRFRTERRVDAFHTVDAGSNVHLLYQPAARAFVEHFVHAHKHMFTLSRGVARHRYRVVLLCGKRYAGKTHLSEELARCGSAFQTTFQTASLSTELKRSFWQQSERQREEEDDVESREVKERFRARMIAFGESYRERDPYHWCRMLWDGLDARPTDVLVTDARRTTDVDFFRKCSDCRLVRVRCDDETRRARGWAYDPIVDDATSETGLDDARYDEVVGPTRDPEELLRHWFPTHAT